MSAETGKVKLTVSCAWCKAIMVDCHTQEVSHGICGDCVQTYFPAYAT